MFNRKLLMLLGLVLVWGVSLSANAGTMVLDSFVDQSPATINLPATDLLMATVNTSSAQGGNDAAATAVSISGTVVPADVASVCVDYNAVQVSCQTNLGSLSNISLSLGGNQKGGSPFDYRVTLNSSAGGKTIQLTVQSITNTNLTDNIPLPQSTALRNIVGAVNPPTVTVSPATNIGQNEATLGGNVTSDGGATVTERGIVWNTTSPAEAGGAPVPIGSGTGPFSQLVSGLPAGTLVYFKAYAVNSAGTAYSGTEQSFTTQSVAPTLTAPTFANVTDSTATLGGTVTNAGAPPSLTACGVEWGTSPGTWPNNLPGGAPCSVGTPFTVSVSSLPSSTTIYFHAWATNSGSTTGYTAENSFTTTAQATPPTVTVAPATNIGQNSATLGGNVTSDGSATVTERGIVWNTTSPAESGGTSVPIGSGTGPFSQLVSGLPAGTLVYFKAYAVNSAGTAYSGTEESFTTNAGLPTVGSPTVTSITATTATLGGTVSSNGGGALTDCGVQWGTTSGGPYPNSFSDGVCTVSVPFTVPVSGLPTGTLVYYRAYAANSAGTAYSAQDSFTPAGPPVVTVTAATAITDTTAVLGGDVTSDGGASVTARGIVWHTTTPPETGGTVVPMGSGTGAFSQTVSGLPPSTLIYFKAYATNSAATSYSGQDSFTTEAPTGPIQASNVLIDRISSKSMRIRWTRGNGDGSIAVLRLQATARTDPFDSDDYTGNPDYTAAPEVLIQPGSQTGSQNYVVHKGPEASVWVTGLDITTSYSVAVYEYTGTGASTVYVPNPVEATQATNDIPMHNPDYRVDCTDCHIHGTFPPARADKMKAQCEGCHNPLGKASAKLEFDNHLTPNKNPDIPFVDCGMCHEMHLQNASDTTQSINSVSSVTAINKSFLRANVNKYVPNAATPAYLHTDQPARDGIPADNPDRAVEGGNDTTARGYCQVCHTLTNYHRSSNTALANQCHDGAANDSCGPAEVNCGACHQHKGAFAADGGACTTCHDQQQGSLPRPIITTQFDRFSSHIKGGSGVVAQEDCQVCHDQSTHKEQTVRMLDADDGVTSYAQATAGASTLAAGEGEQFAPACLSCHGDGVAASLPASGAEQTQTSPFTGSAASPVIDATAWLAASHNRPTSENPTNPVTCLGDGVNGCHGSGHGSEQLKLLAPATGAAISATDFCFNCHDPNGPSSIDIKSLFNGLTYTTTGDNGGGSPINGRHDVIAADQSVSGGVVTCADCHQPHVNNDANPASDPDTGLTLATYSPTGSYTDDGHNWTYNNGTNQDPVNPQGLGGSGRTEPDYINFCLTCHDGTTPPGVTMAPGMINLAAAYPNDHHGRVTGGGAGQGYLKYPWNTNGATSDPATPYASLNCTQCHGPHGGNNIFNLRESITVAGVQMTIGGWAGDSIGTPRASQYADPTTYILPPMNGRNIDETNGLQEDHYWGAWCSFCHQMESHGQKEENACRSGHMHGEGAF